MCSKADSPITSIDISSDAQYIQAATATDELHFYSVADGSRLSIPAVTRDTDWATVTVPFGWRVQGCWKAREVGGDNNNTGVEDIDMAPRFQRSSWTSRGCTSPGVSCVHRSPNGQILAKGCTDGTVAIYRYPTQGAGMGMVTAAGHGSRIAKVRFTCDGGHLVALGQFNRTITVYKVAKTDIDEESKPHTSHF